MGTFNMPWLTTNLGQCNEPWQQIWLFGSKRLKKMVTKLLRGDSRPFVILDHFNKKSRKFVPNENISTESIESVL